jgi:hypothetical protein
MNDEQHESRTEPLAVIGPHHELDALDHYRIARAVIAPYDDGGADFARSAACALVVVMRAAHLEGQALRCGLSTHCRDGLEHFLTTMSASSDSTISEYLSRFTAACSTPESPHADRFLRGCWSMVCALAVSPDLENSLLFAQRAILEARRGSVPPRLRDAQPLTR